MNNQHIDFRVITFTVFEKKNNDRRQGTRFERSCRLLTRDRISNKITRDRPHKRWQHLQSDTILEVRGISCSEANYNPPEPMSAHSGLTSRVRRPMTPHSENIAECARGYSFSREGDRLVRFGHL
uniref:Uncharacterized protein n=1 Tax=Rhipicephalus microplus TaxID=6941 RepID=A0A6G5AI57_RHIMP